MNLHKKMKKLWMMLFFYAEVWDLHVIKVLKIKEKNLE